MDATGRAALEGVVRRTTAEAGLVRRARIVLLVAHFTPVHCSRMNPVEQWFGILRRKRLRSPNFADLPALQRAIHKFITEWNEIAHPFRWTAKSYEKILAKLDAAIAASASELPTAA